MSEEKKKGRVARLREGLSKTRGNMTEKVDDMVRENRKIDEDFYEELEDILLMADCGLKATDEIVDELRNRVKAGAQADHGGADGYPAASAEVAHGDAAGGCERRG